MVRPALLLSVVASVIVAVVGSTPAGILATLAVREATSRADGVALAELLEWDDGGPTTQPAGGAQVTARFKITEVLKGDLKVGQEITLSLSDHYQLRPPAWLSRNGRTSELPKIQQAILYLHMSQKGHELVGSGIRMTTDGKAVLSPQQMMNPGPYYLLPAKGQAWADVVERARKEVKNVAGVLAMKEIADAGKRNQAILAWAREHQKELSGGWFEYSGAKDGWGSLAQEVFQWVYDSYRVDDAWTAIKLQTDADVGFSGSVPSCFGTSAARKMLIDVATDTKQSARYRELALRLICVNCWPTYDQQRQHGQNSLDAKEQTMLLDKLSPLLKDKDELVRAEAVDAIAAVSMPYDADGIKRLGTKRMVPVLVELYKSDSSKQVRYALDNALSRLEGENKWQALTQPAK